MRNITTTSLKFTLLLCFILNLGLSAQVLIKKIPLEAQIKNSNLIIEGKVIEKKSTWDDKHELIYTINTIEVYKVFKGIPVSTVEVITIGGTVGMQALVAYPSLKLRNGDIGVFILENNATSFSKTLNYKSKKYKPNGVTQGFYKYNLVENLAATPFVKKQNISSDFYNEIQKYLNSNYVELKEFDTDKKLKKSDNGKLFLPPSSITLNKTIVTAGTGDLLTITGTDFGAVAGTVSFRDADSGGASFVNPLDSQIISWSDTQIEVEVPSEAGTGTIRVQDANGGVSPLSEILTVLYSEINVETDPDGNDPIPLTAYQVQHVGQNSSGGMTWRMQTDFFNDTEFPGAKAAFMRSFDKWVCESGINWEVAATATTIDTAGSGTDGTNVIRFDNGNELNANTLGICYSWFGGCFSGSGTLEWFVSELDLVFNDNANWHTGVEPPPFRQFDFESIALHELGHGHQLGHIIDPNDNSIGNNAEDVMHFVFSNGERQRAISANNSTAANSIQNRSTGSSVCGQSIMVDASCTLSKENSILDISLSIYPNPATNKLSIKNSSYLDLKSASLYDISGRHIIEFDISNGSKLKTINLETVSSGVYFIIIASNEASTTRKLIIE